MAKRRPTKRTWEQRANNRRAAWNRVGASFNVPKVDLDLAKTFDLNPYPILHHSDAYSNESVKSYIHNGGAAPKNYEKLADYLVDREIDRLTEIAQLEDDGYDCHKIIERVGEHWW